MRITTTPTSKINELFDEKSVAFYSLKIEFSKSDWFNWNSCLIKQKSLFRTHDNFLF